MKNLKAAFLLIFLVSLTSVIFAQDTEMKYLFGGKGKVKVSGFVAPIMEFSAMGDRFAFFMGGGGAILFNQAFYFGAYGEGLTTPYEKEIVINPLYSWKTTQRIGWGHGGFWLGYIHRSQAPVHAGISSRIGWGAINLWEENLKDGFSSDYTDHVFVAIPQVEVEFNFFRWLKANVGVG